MFLFSALSDLLTLRYIHLFLFMPSHFSVHLFVVSSCNDDIHRRFFFGFRPDGQTVLIPDNEKLQCVSTALSTVPHNTLQSKL